MRGKPRGQYGPTGERNSGIRYVPPKEQKEMADQWQEQQDRIAALEAERDAARKDATYWHDQAIAAADEGLSEDELAADRAAIERFRQQIARDLRDAEERGRVTTRVEWRGYLKKAVERERVLRNERDELRVDLHTRNNQLAAAQFSLELAYDDIKRAIALLPAEPGAALGVLVSSVRAQNAPQASPASASEAIGA